MQMWRGTTLSSLLHGSITILLVASIPILSFMPESAPSTAAPGAQSANALPAPDENKEGPSSTAPAPAALPSLEFPSTPPTPPRTDNTPRETATSTPDSETAPVAIEIVSVEDLPRELQEAIKKLPPLEKKSAEPAETKTPGQKPAENDRASIDEKLRPDTSRPETPNDSEKTAAVKTETLDPGSPEPEKTAKAEENFANSEQSKPDDSKQEITIAKKTPEKERTTRSGTGGEFGAGGPGGTGTDGRGAKGSIERKPQRPVRPLTLDTEKRAKTVDELLERLAQVLPRIGRDAKIGGGVSNSTTIRSRQAQNLERLLKAAKNGHANAQYNAAKMLIRGEGTEPDPEEALKWLKKSAERGYVRAQILMGVLSATGVPGQEANLGDADFWWALAERKGSKPAAAARKLLRPKLTSTDILHSQRRQGEHRRLFDFLPKPFQQLSAGGDGINEDLREAASAGNTRALLDALLKGADVDGQDIDGKTAMINAAWRGRKEIIRILLEQGADLEVADNRGRSPIMWAAINGHSQIVEELLQSGSQFDQPDDEGLTPLMRAAWNGHTAIVNRLLLEGADPTRRDFKGKTALDHAKRENHPDIVARLKEISR